MNDKTGSEKAFQALREQAELLLKQRGSPMPDLDKNDFLRLAHELEVQQVELEVQNEELRGAKKELEQSREEFLDLYESAPVAYITLNEKGIIDRANRAACRLFEDFREIRSRPAPGRLGRPSARHGPRP